MNRTQKSAWFGLVVPCFPVVWFLSVGITTQNELLMLVPIVVFLLLAPVVMFLVIGKKQRPDEVMVDERDYIIRSKALLAGFISVFVMLVVSSILMHLAADDRGMVEVDIMLPLTILIFILAIAVYSAAILIQYGRGGKDGDICEGETL